ncbi:autotransporter family protein [Pseudothauera rhizosphaerae]|nr:autotransporter outer membrane beta-barrel domain-containing protein [Pseudothauera rhizosphaerae]
MHAFIRAERGGQKHIRLPFMWQPMALSAIPLFLFLSGERAFAQCTTIDAGTVTCSGNEPSGLTIVPPPPPGPDVAVTVEPGATINGSVVIDGLMTLWFQNNGQINGNVTITGNGDLTFDQNGTFGGTTLSATGSGSNELIVRTGRSVNTVILSGAENRVDNFGVLNNSVTLNATSSNTVINRTGAAINQLILSGPLNTIDNSGLFNQGLAFANAHTASSQYDNTIINRATGVINGISSTGNAFITISNSGVINGPVNLGSGNDLFANRLQTNGSVNLGDGNDIFAQFEGTICCTVNLGNGNDLAFIFDGTISSDVQAGAGNDTLAWQGGRIVAGIRMGEGSDYALLSGLDATNLVSGLLVDGGLSENDRLVWSNTQNGSTGLDVAQLTYWESIALNFRSQLTFKNYSTLTLGDPGTGTGVISIDSSSAALAGNGTHAVRPWNPGALVSVNNAGTIDLTNGPATATDRFVIYGNYTGQNGRLNLQTVLGSDDSPSDQLVIQKNSSATANPTASGLTALNVSNLNGPGAMTTGDGIRVVDAVGGAVTTAGAFVLGSRVAAGVYEYALFRGGVTSNAANDNDWFLRSSVSQPVVPPTVLPIPVPPPPIPPTTLPAPVPTIPLEPTPPGPAPPSPPSTLPAPLPPAPLIPTPPLPIPPPPEPPPVDPPPEPPTPPVDPPEPPTPPVDPPPVPPVDPPSPPDIPLIRPEIPGYVLMPAMAQQIGMAAIGTFHQRRGDQALLDVSGTTGNAWARVFGDDRDQRWRSRVGGIDYQLSPQISSRMWGVQVGSDLYARSDEQGREDRAGAFYTHTETHGTVFGNTLSIDRNRSGDLDLTGDSIGLYWTRIGPRRWYVDTVAMYTHFRGDAESKLGAGADIHGSAFAASLESGVPFPLDGKWTIEPQGQIVWQRIGLDDTRDPYSSIDYRDFDALTGRLGVRLEHDTLVRSRPWQSFLSLNVWRNFGKTSNVTFEDTKVATSLGGTSLELRGGMAMKLSDNVAAFLSVSYTTKLDGRMQHGVGGIGGVRVRW